MELLLDSCSAELQRWGPTAVFIPNLSNVFTGVNATMGC